MNKKEKTVFQKGFFTQSRPHVKKQDSSTKPFDWDKNILEGKSKVKIVSTKNKTC